MARNQIKKFSPAKFFPPLWPWCFIVFDLSGLFLRKIWFLRLKKACIKKSAGFNFLFFSKLQSNVYYALRKFKNIYMSVYCSMHMCRLTRPLCILVPHVLPAYAFQKAFMTQKWGIAFLALKHSASSDWFDKNVCMSILFNKVNSFFEYKPKTRATFLPYANQDQDLF